MKFAAGDKVAATNGVTGEVKHGTVLKSAPLKDWKGRVVIPELLSITWEDGTVDHNFLPEGVEKTE